MKKILALCMAALLLFGLLTPVFAETSKSFAGVHFTITDVIREKSVSFNGAGGQPTVLVFSIGFGSGSDDKELIRNLAAALRKDGAPQPQVFLLSLFGDSASEGLSALGNDPPPRCVFAGNLTNADVLIYFYQSNSISFSSPLMIYLDKNGTVVHYSEGEAPSEDEIGRRLSGIGSAPNPGGDVDPGGGIDFEKAFGPDDKKGMKRDFTDVRFTMTDITRNQKVTFNGNDGQPKIFISGVFNDCPGDAYFDRRMLNLFCSYEGQLPQIYYLSARGKGINELREWLGSVRLPDNMYFGSENSLRGMDLSAFLNEFYGYIRPRIQSPLIIYLDAQGKLVHYSEGAVSLNEVSKYLSEIGGAYEPAEISETADDYMEIPLCVQYRQTEAREELAMVNALRTGADAWYWNEDNKTKTVATDLQPLTYDYALERVAMQRALELVLLYAHDRPTGDHCFAAYHEQGYDYRAAGENIAMGQKTVKQVQTDWEEKDKTYFGQGHRRNMLDRSFRAFGCACVEYKGTRYWVQEFSDTVNEAAQTPANDASVVGTASVFRDDIIGWTVTPEKLPIGIGQTEDLNACIEVRMRYLSDREEKSLAVALKPEWKSADPSVASVSSDGKVTGKKIGSTTLTAAMPNGEGVSVSLTVREDTIDFSPVTEPVKMIGNYLYCAPGTSLDEVTRFCGNGTMFDRWLNGGFVDELPKTVVNGLRVYTPEDKVFIVAVMGDVDCDGAITASDARMALRIAVGLETNLAIWQFTACHVDNDWSHGVNAGQARLILRGAVGLERPENWFLAVEDD